MEPKTINLHIDRVVLDGIGQMDRGQLSITIERELHRLISMQGLHSSLHQSGSINKISAKPITFSSSVREKSLGNKIAGSVYREMKK